MARRSGRFDTRGGMGKFKITVARIELAGRGSQVRITFQVEGAPTCFQVPILLDIGDFDDTEMVPGSTKRPAPNVRRARGPMPTVGVDAARPPAAVEHELASKGTRDLNVATGSKLSPSCDAFLAPTTGLRDDCDVDGRAEIAVGRARKTAADGDCLTDVAGNGDADQIVAADRSVPGVVGNPSGARDIDVGP